MKYLKASPMPVLNVFIQPYSLSYHEKATVGIFLNFLKKLFVLLFVLCKCSLWRYCVLCLVLFNVICCVLWILFGIVITSLEKRENRGVFNKRRGTKQADCFCFNRIKHVIYCMFS